MWSRVTVRSSWLIVSLLGRLILLWSKDRQAAQTSTISLVNRRMGQALLVFWSLMGWSPTCVACAQRAAKWAPQLVRKLLHRPRPGHLTLTHPAFALILLSSYSDRTSLPCCLPSGPFGPAEPKVPSFNEGDKVCVALKTVKSQFCLAGPSRHLHVVAYFCVFLMRLGLAGRAGLAAVLRIGATNRNVLARFSRNSHMHI